jgi:hypothetical protein
MLESVSCGIKQWFTDSETTQSLGAVQDLLSEPFSDTCSSRPAYMDEALKHANSLVPPLDVHTSHEARVPADVFADLEIFDAYRTSESTTTCPYPGEGPVNLDASTETVFGCIDKTQLRGSRAYLRSLLLKPTSDYACLSGRHAALAALQEKLACSSAATDALLAEMAKLERDVAWLYRPQEQELEALHDMTYFHGWFLSHLNSSSACLTALNLYKIVVSPLIGILSPVVYFILPFAILRMHYGVRIPFKTYIAMLWRSFVAAGSGFLSPHSQLGQLGQSPANGSWIKYLSCGFSLVFYFQSLFTSFEISKTLHNICSIIVQRMNRVSAFFSKGIELLQTFWRDDHMGAFFQAPQVTDVCNYHPDVDVTTSNFQLWSNFGRELKAFRTFDHTSHAVLLRRIYVTDTLLSIVRLRSVPGYCRADFIAPGIQQGPTLQVSGGWHPCIPYDVNIKNDYGMGGQSPPGMMLTGPNAGGKSTLLKSMMLAALLAQTLLTVPARSLRLTPFSYLNSHVNVPDCKGRASLFEAEMNRAKCNVENLRSLKASDAVAPIIAHTNTTSPSNSRPRYAFIIMDEIFSSTNPVEGIAGGYAVAKNLAETGLCLCAISTHFTYLCKLAKRTGLYTNWQMPVDHQQEKRNNLKNITHVANITNIAYPYKLQRGVCQQYIALELLRRTNFDKAILDDAVAIKDEMMMGKGITTPGPLQRYNHTGKQRRKKTPTANVVVEPTDQDKEHTRTTKNPDPKTIKKTIKTGNEATTLT